MIAILEAKSAGLLSNEHWFNNILAGMIVGMVALPLAIAIVKVLIHRCNRLCNRIELCGIPASAIKHT